MSDSKDRLPEASDDLLSKVADLRETERRRREQPISSPEFHDLETEITRKSHDIMYAARREEAIGNDTETGDESIEDVDDRRRAS